jgi:hypothetical protein
MTTWLLRRLLAEVRFWLGRLGYWVRPFDMLADRRRWRWQSATPCWYAVLCRDGQR